MEELVASGYENHPRQVIPARVWDGLSTKIGDGTVVRDAGSFSVGAIVGGAKIHFQSMDELNGAGYGQQPIQAVPKRIWDGLSTTIADGTYVKAPSSTAVWLISGGRRTAAQQTAGVQVIPDRLLNAIPQA